LVVHAKPRQEAVALEHLGRQGFDAWLPRASVTRRRGERWVERVEPLFPRYLFLDVDADEMDVAPVRSTRGCVGLVRFGDRPARVPAQLISWLRGAADPETGLHRVGRSLETSLGPGARVRVLSGPFEGAEGVLQSLRGEERALVFLDVLARAARVELPVGQLGALGT
jgi:transcriptional antiterminator RfaH